MSSNTPVVLISSWFKKFHRYLPLENHFIEGSDRMDERDSIVRSGSRSGIAILEISRESLSITNFEGHGLVIMSKCHLFTPWNVYLGNVPSSEGVRPLENLARNGDSKKISIIIKARRLLFSRSFSLLALEGFNGKTHLVLVELEHGELELELEKSEERRGSLEFGFFLIEIKCLTISFSSATSDETAGVEELVLTFETMALLRD
ncbi:hypothetical protein Tco_1252207 [Tanacetum coccineum]